MNGLAPGEVVMQYVSIHGLSILEEIENGRYHVGIRVPLPFRIEHVYVPRKTSGGFSEPTTSMANVTAELGFHNISEPFRGTVSLA